MWKSKHKFVNIVIVCFLFIITTFHSSADTSIPKYVKIGLKYGSSAPSVVSLQAVGGFKISMISGNNTYDLMNIQDENIKTKKDSYHIAVDRNFDSIEDALNFKRELDNLGLSAYVYYDGSYSVCLGSFNSKDEALSKIKDLYNSLSQYSIKVIEPKNNIIELVNQNNKNIFTYDSNKEIGIFSNSNSFITVDKKKCRGSILFKKINANNTNVINRLDLNEYLYGVVPREMSGSWPIEALKSQAVAARSYSIINIGKKHAADGFDLCTTDHCQVYGGVESEQANSTRAVNETGYRTMKYGGKVVNALYHSNSGGKTENSENIWSSVEPYLRGVDDSFSIGYPNDNWTVALTKTDIQNKLVQNKVNIGELVDIKIDEVSQNSRILKIRFIGTKGEKVYTKDSIRSILGLKSIWFDIVKDGQSITSENTNNVGENSSNQGLSIMSSDNTSNVSSMSNLNVVSDTGIKQINNITNLYLSGDTTTKKVNTTTNTNNTYKPPIVQSGAKYVFNGHGWGHGVGMSQYGAKKMAETGYTYEDILKHYYTGVQIEE